MPERHFIQSFYEILTLLGVDPSNIEPNIQHSSGEGHIAIGCPTYKVGATIEGCEPDPFVEDGWFIVPMSTGQLQALDVAFQNISSFAFEYTRRTTMETTKQTSQHEQWLIDAVIKRDLPIPERNWRLSRDDGSELTTPDMAWPELKVAFFVDGLWWHVAKDDRNMLDLLQDDSHREQLMDQNKTRVERDLAIRSEMQSKGWKILACTDRDLESYKGVQEQVNIIEATLKLAQRERSLKNETADSSILSLLDDDD